MISAEKMLWNRIKTPIIAGLRFRRRMNGACSTVFFCDRAGMVVRINRASCNRSTKKNMPAEKGLLTMRFRHDEVANNLDGVVDTITRCAVMRIRE